MSRVERKISLRKIARDVASESVIGCLTHFLLTVAGIALLAGAFQHRRWSDRILFVLIALLLFAGAVFLPIKIRKE